MNASFESARMNMRNWDVGVFATEIYDYRNSLSSARPERVLDCSGLDSLTKAAYDKYEEAAAELESSILNYCWSRGLAAVSADYLRSLGTSIPAGKVPDWASPEDMPEYETIKQPLEQYAGDVLAQLGPEQRQEMEELHGAKLSDMWQFGGFAFVHGYEWGLMHYEKLGYTGDYEKLESYYKRLL